MNLFRPTLIALAIAVIPGITATAFLSSSLHADEGAQSVKKEELRQEVIPVAERPDQFAKVPRWSVWTKSYQSAVDALEVLSSEREQQEKERDALASSREPGSPPSLEERQMEARIHRTSMSIGWIVGRIKRLTEMQGKQEVLRGDRFTATST